MAHSYINIFTLPNRQLTTLAISRHNLDPSEYCGQTKDRKWNVLEMTQMIVAVKIMDLVTFQWTKSNGV